MYVKLDSMSGCRYSKEPQIRTKTLQANILREPDEVKMLKQILKVK